MAGIATDLGIAMKRSLVNVQHHFDHDPCGELLFLFVRRIVPLTTLVYMTVIASHSERCGHVIHHWNQLRLGQAVEDLDVLLDLFDGLFLCGRRGWRGWSLRRHGRP